MVAPNRQERPVDVGAAAWPSGETAATGRSVALKAGGSRQPGCPFCPGSGKVPDDYTVLSYDNDYPTLALGPVEPSGSEADGPYGTAPAYGKCEVILYSPDHNAVLWRLPQRHVRELVDLWADRSVELSKDPGIKYVFIFENRGAEVGVTLHHPHGQLYAYPFVPLKIAVELDSSKRYFQKQGRCLICDMNREEVSSGKRLIAENAGFVCYLPFFTDYPFGAFIVSRRHTAMLADLDSRERDSLAAMLRGLVGAFDRLFRSPFPYMMCVHQGPVNDPLYRDTGDYYHFHIEFYPPLRDADRIKYYASSEMGAWAACNPLLVEETAGRLRDAFKEGKRD